MVQVTGVWLVEFTVEGSTHYSIHRTRDGAMRKLQERCDEHGTGLVVADLENDAHPMDAAECFTARRGEVSLDANWYPVDR